MRKKIIHRKQPRKLHKRRSRKTQTNLSYVGALTPSTSISNPVFNVADILKPQQHSTITQPGGTLI